MSKALLRNDNGNPFLYLEDSTGSTCVGIDDATDTVNLITTDAATDINPASGGASIAIQSTTPGDIQFSPKGIGQSTFVNGNVEILGDAGSDGNLLMKITAVGGASGVIEFGGNRFIHQRGSNNTFLGLFAGNTNIGLTGANNAGLGTASLGSITSGANNTTVGFNAASQLTTASSNTAAGSACMFAVTTGNQNTAVGNIALNSLTTGSNNIAIGRSSGSLFTSTESSNIVIGNAGVALNNNTIRIGTQGAGAGQQNQCFIAGINGTSVTAAGTVVVSSTGQLGTIASFPTVWNEITAASAGMSVNNGYIAFRATLVTLTLPAVAAQGSRLEILGKGTGGFLIAQNAGQTIRFNSLSTTTGVAGSLASTLQYNAVQLICITANTDFIVESSSGNLTVV